MPDLNPHLIQEAFKPLVGKKSWRVRLGWGSFITFDFGPTIKKNDHRFGEWHLWIYQCEWRLKSRHKTIVTSDSTRHAIRLAVRKLERFAFVGVYINPRNLETRFTFSHDFKLICIPPSNLAPDEKPDHCEYWMFFMPGNQVLLASPVDGITIAPSNLPGHAGSQEHTLKRKKCAEGLDDCSREADGTVRRKRADTLMKNLRDEYGKDFALGLKSDATLGTVRDRTSAESLRRVRGKKPK